MKELMKKVAKLFAALSSVATTALIVTIFLAINPWNVLKIFKRNYPDWFEAHPHISNLIKLD